MKNKKGFTIVELVIVIAVIAILAAVLIPTFSTIVGKANNSSALQTTRNNLTNALNITTTATLAGKTEQGAWQTVFVVDSDKKADTTADYAFGYTGNQLEQLTIKEGKLEGESFSANSVIFSNDMATSGSNATLSDLAKKIIENFTEKTVNTVEYIDATNSYKITMSDDTTITAYPSFDFSKDTVCFTTFG